MTTTLYNMLMEQCSNAYNKSFATINKWSLVCGYINELSNEQLLEVLSSLPDVFEYNVSGYDFRDCVIDAIATHIISELER